MPATLRWALLCSQAVQHAGTLNIIGAGISLFAVAAEGDPVEFSIAMVVDEPLEEGQGLFSMSVRILNEGGEEKFSYEVAPLGGYAGPPPPPQMRFVTTPVVMNLPVKDLRFGWYDVVLELDRRAVAKLPIRVTQAPAVTQKTLEQIEEIAASGYRTDFYPEADSGGSPVWRCRLSGINHLSSGMGAAASPDAAFELARENLAKIVE